MNRSARAFFLALGLAFLPIAGHAGPEGESDTVVCRLPQIRGLENEYKEAVSVLGWRHVKEDSIDSREALEEIGIYVTYRDGKIYAQTNFENTGADGNVTKISTPATPDATLLVLARNLLIWQPEATPKVITNETLRSRLQYTIDSSVFVSNISAMLKIEQFSRVHLRAPRGEIVPLRTIPERDEKPRSWAAELRPQILVPVVDLPRIALVELALATRFDPEAFHVLSLVGNTETNEELVALFGDKSTPFPDGGYTKETFLNALRIHSGEVLFILGHIELTDFVVRSPKGEKRLAIPVAEIIGNAEAAHVAVVPLGCNSALASGRSGVVGTFNTLEVTRQLHKAVEKRNFGEMLQRLVISDDGTPLMSWVFEPDAVLSYHANQAIRFNGHKLRKGKITQKIGTVVLGDLSWYGRKLKPTVQEDRPSPPARPAPPDSLAPTLAPVVDPIRGNRSDAEEDAVGPRSSCVSCDAANGPGNALATLTFLAIAVSRRKRRG